MHDSLPVGIDLSHTVEHLAQWDVSCIRNSGNRDFVPLTHINNLNIFSIVEALFKFSCGDFRNWLCSWLTHESSEGD
jgi:hypothetical protein